MKNLTYLALAVLCIFTFSACEETTQRGCIDPLAINYESWADYDDGSCLYEADVVFFYNAITANELNIMGFDRLDFYIEEEPGTFILAGSEYPAPSYIYAGIPDCYDNTYVTVPIEWYTTNNTVINYLVFGITYVGQSPLEVETEVDQFSFELYPNECAAVQIRFVNIQETSTKK